MMKYLSLFAGVFFVGASLVQQHKMNDSEPKALAAY